MRIRIIKSIYILALFPLAGCSDQPTKLSGQEETIKVSYVNWACDCADFIEAKYFKDSDYEIREEDCIFIEPANKDNKVPDDYYDQKHFDYYLKLIGQFYEDKGIPDSYERKTPVSPEKARVFRYESYKLVKKE